MLVNVSLISFIKLVGFDLVMIQPVSSAKRIQIYYYYYFFFFYSMLLFYVISIKLKYEGPSIKPWRTPCFNIPQLEQDL
jgi:hypothetical protein